MSPKKRQTAELIGAFLLYTRDLPREEVARIAGISRATLTRWERLPPKMVPLPVRMRLMQYVSDQERTHAAANLWNRHPRARTGVEGVDRLEARIERLSEQLAWLIDRLSASYPPPAVQEESRSPLAGLRKEVPLTE
jgi:transcriptional regulator with XRE-family HTH domain